MHKMHVKSHKNSDSEVMRFQKSLPQKTLSFTKYAGAMALVHDVCPVSFTDSKQGIRQYGDAVFRLGEPVAASESINPKCLVASAWAVGAALKQKADNCRKDFNDGLMKDVLGSGGGVATDCLTQKVQDKLYYV